MAIGSEMKKLTQDIASSKAERADLVKRVKEETSGITGDARQLITGFRDSRRKAGTRLRSELTRGKVERNAEVKQALEDARELVSSFSKRRKESSTDLRQELARGAAERGARVKSILSEARESISSFRSGRKMAGDTLKKELARSQSERQSAVKKLKAEARNLITGMEKEREKSAGVLRQELAQGRIDLHSEVKAMRSELRRSRDEVKSDLKEARAAWQELAHREKLTAVAAPEEKTKAPEAPPADGEIPDLEAKLLAAINDHPDGITLAEVAESLGVVPVVLGRASRKLLDEGKIRKEDRLYYPAAHE